MIKFIKGWWDRITDDGWRQCPTCKGSGLEDVHPDSPLYGSDCEDCAGTGEFYIPYHAEMG